MVDDCCTDCEYIQWNDFSPSCGFDLSIVSLNLQSLPNKFTELHSCLSLLRHKFTFIVIVETWLKKDTDLGFEIDGYNSISLCRETANGGGIKIYYRNNLEVCTIDRFTECSESCECIFMKATLG